MLPFVIKIFVLSVFEWPFTQVLLYSYLKTAYTSVELAHYDIFPTKVGKYGIVNQWPS